MGTWFSLFANWETVLAQLGALAIVLGSYVAAQYLRVWRPRRHGQPGATRPDRPPEEGTAAKRGARPGLGTI